MMNTNILLFVSPLKGLISSWTLRALTSFESYVRVKDATARPTTDLHEHERVEDHGEVLCGRAVELAATGNVEPLVG
jgi:hypothetical protein